MISSNKKSDGGGEEDLERPRWILVLRRTTSLEMVDGDVD